MLSTAVRFCLIAMIGSAPAAAQVDPRDQEIEQLKEMVIALQTRVAALETAAATQHEEEDLAAASTSTQNVDAAPPVSTSIAPQPEDIDLEYASSGAERIDEALSLAQDPMPKPAADESIAFKGAIRYNLFLNEDNDDSTKAASGFDLFRIGADGTKDNITVSAEYRFYSYMNTLHHGWIGYNFPDSGQLQFGVSQVPFGLLPYSSHNYWFGVPYYIGLSDDYDLGLKYVKQNGPWDIALAFYKNEELGSAGDLERYSFDPVIVGDQANEEVNTLNARFAYTLGKGSDTVNEIGLSLQGGELYNSMTDDSGDQWAAGLHWDSRFQRWNVQLELARYEYNPANPASVSDDTIRLGAFASSYDIASRGTVGVANVAYKLPVRIRGVDQILLYNDFSILWKDKDSYDDSILNTTGAALGIGPVFIYLDLIQARNMAYFGDGSLAGDGDDSWETRLNLNVGYYW